MTLEPLTRDDAEQVRIWRNLPEMQATLRTPKRLTYEEQQDWYTREIANRESHTRYWALKGPPLCPDEECETCKKHGVDGKKGLRLDLPYVLVGYGGIEHISWENRNGELSVLIDPARHKQKLGSEAIELFLDQAFNYLNLEAIFAECYECGPTGFWQQMKHKYGGMGSFLPCTKYYDGTYYGSEVTTFTKESFIESDLRYTG